MSVGVSAKNPLIISPSDPIYDTISNSGILDGELYTLLLPVPTFVKGYPAGIPINVAVLGIMLLN